MNIKVLVTGAKGQLGKTIQELFGNNKDGIDFTFLSKTELDITNQEDLNGIFSEKSYHYCVNCAAYTNVEQAEKTPEIAYKINAEAVKHLAEICEIYHTVLVHISTDYVFNGTKRNPYTIKDKTNPINEYGKSKLLGEHYIQQSLKRYFIIRTSWLYSKTYGNNFYKTILEKAKKDEKLTITTSQKSCPTNTISLAHRVYKIIKENNRNFGLYHFSDAIEMTWYDFAKRILIENELFDKINLVKADNYVTFAERPEYSVLENNL